MLYYRKFGFEIGCFGKQCQYLLSMIPSFDMKDGYFVLVDESNRKQVLSDVKQLYGAWEVKYNGMIHNEGYEYAFVTESNPYKDQEFTYLYYREGKEGLQGFLALVKTMESDHVQVIFTIPACKTMECLVKEWSMGAFSENQIPLGMVRVVNVERVLKKAAYRGNGQVILGITNSVLPQNNGSYWIRFTNGTLTAIERMPQDQVP